jgi:hypothetical protein
MANLDVLLGRVIDLADRGPERRLYDLSNTKLSAQPIQTTVQTVACAGAVAETIESSSSPSQ